MRPASSILYLFLAGLLATGLTQAQDTPATAPATPAPGASPPVTPSAEQLDKVATESEKETAKETKGEKKEGKKTTKGREAPGSFRPDFRDQEIGDILKIFSKIIGKNIIADEKVKGKITVISPYKIPNSLAYPYLYSMLAIKGFGIIEENENLIRVVALKDALAGSPLIYLGREEIKDATLKSDLAVTQILPVFGGKPSRLSAILKRLTSANTDLVEYDDINMLIISGSQFEVNRLIRVANLIDVKPPELQGCDKEKNPNCDEPTIRDVHVYRLENMQAENVEATLKKVQIPIESPPPPNAAATAGGAPAPTVTQANLQKKAIDVIGHKETNSIIFVGTPEEYKLVKDLIKRIDLQRQQVLLEVLIVEVGSADNRSFGIDWIAGKGGTAQFNGGIAQGSGLINQQGQLDGGRTNTSSGFSFTFLQQDQSNIIGILNAQVGKSNFTVVSAPQVLALDNQEAEINVGQDVPVRVNSLTNSVGGNVTQSFEYRPVGIKLKFTPQVNKNRMVTINLFQEVKSVVAASDPAANPTISKKDIKTFVRVQDTQTIVIGGLISNERNSSVVKVPILGDLPLVGFIFRRSKSDVTRKNLMVFITPHILTNRKIADKVTDDLREDQIKENKRGQLP